MMTAQAAGTRSRVAAAHRPRREALTHRTVAATALYPAGSTEGSPECQFLGRYAELKSCEPEAMRDWLESLDDEQLILVRDVFATAAADCEDEVHGLSAQPFRATADQIKLVPQFWSDGTPFVNFRKPRLNTVDAIDDALGSLFVPALRNP